MRVVRALARTAAAALTAAALAAALAPGALAGECDDVMLKSEVEPGMTGTGFTVSRGRTPEPFDVEVLGIVPSYAGPGRDVILVEADSPAIRRAGGIWYGMSGSPVYIGGRLVGALAYGFSATTRVAGLTPADDMADLLTLRSIVRTGAAPRAVALPPALARTVSARTGLPASAVDTITQLRVPLSVSGLAPRRLPRVGRWASKRGLAVLPYAGSSASGLLPAVAEPLEPGSNFAAAASYGDVTIAAIGTTTYVCDGRALAFGHPFTFGGLTSAGANAADALAVVEDPLFGPYKLATVAETLGLVDQDRLAGLRALLGREPSGVPIRSTVTASDTGRTRSGETDIVVPDWVSFGAFLHVLSNLDTTYDAITRGTAAAVWTIRGTRADGTPWRISRRNLYANRYDITFEAAFDALDDLFALADYPFEDVAVTGMTYSATLQRAVRQFTIARVLSAKGGGPLRARRVLRVAPGERIRVRVVLDPFEAGPNRVVDFSFRLPRRGRPVGVIQVGGGQFNRPGGEEEEEDGVALPTFDDVLNAVRGRPRNDVLTADLRAGERMKLRQRRRTTVAGVVVGAALIELRPAGQGGGGGAAPPAVGEG